MAKETVLGVKGMSCASCVARVEKAASQVRGVVSVDVNLALESVRVRMDSKSSIEEVIGAVQKAGYQAFIHDADDEHPVKEKKAALKKEFRKVILGFALSAPLVLPMLLSPFGIHWMPSGWIQLLLTLPIQFGLGARFYVSAFKAVRAGAGNMDLLVAIGTSAAFGLSLYHLFAGDHMNLYFESAAVIITLVLFGKYLESRAKFQTTDAIRALQSLRPDVARVRRDGKDLEIPMAEVVKGDTVLIRPGERVPVDGRVLEGQSTVDESLITGESLPVLKEKNESVTGGSMNGEGLLLVQVTAVGRESALQKIIRAVESAQNKKAPIQKLVDRVSAVFVPVVLLIGAVTFLSWGFYSGNWEMALINGVAVLVIACPCALGLATPTSIMVGTGVGARRGILIKDVEALELTHSVTVVAFDKTGTLTEGKPKVAKFYVGEGDDESSLLGIMAGIQSGSEHPLAKAILDYAHFKKVTARPADGVKAVVGRGVGGSVDGKKYFIGTENFLTEMGLLSSVAKDYVNKFGSSGYTVSYLFDKDRVYAAIAFEDLIKPSAKDAVDKLHRMKVKTIMLTGDNQSVADKVARRLGIDEVFAHVLPEMKLKVIEDLRKKGEVVAMVGDGINDAPALAAAHVGLAMSTGTDVAMNTAGITLMRGEPLLIPQAIRISRRTYNKIRQNLFWAFIYNVIGIPLAALGFLSPVLAGAAMAFSSVSVVVNSLSLKFHQDD